MPPSLWIAIAVSAGGDLLVPPSSALVTRPPSMALIRALVKALSVRTLSWWPRKLRALPPCAWMAIAVSAAETCSPVAASASTSRESGSGRDVGGQLEEPVRLAGHGADDHHTSLPARLRGERARGDVLDAIDGADRGAAEFLDDEGHGRPPDYRSAIAGQVARRGSGRQNAARARAAGPM